MLVGARCREKITGGENLAHFISVLLLPPNRNAAVDLLIVLCMCSAIRIRGSSAFFLPHRGGSWGECASCSYCLSDEKLIAPGNVNWTTNTFVDSRRGLRGSGIKA